MVFLASPIFFPVDFKINSTPPSSVVFFCTSHLYCIPLWFCYLMVHMWSTWYSHPNAPEVVSWHYYSWVQHTFCRPLSISRHFSKQWLCCFFFNMLILSSKHPVQKAPLAAWHLTISFEVRSANFHSHLQHLFFIAFALACPHMYDIFHFLVFLFSSLLGACFGHSIGIPLMLQRLFSERTYHHHKHCLSQSTKLFFLLKGCSHILER